MRLTCPNCEAQYEVPDEVIPVSGRDVQCSNCGDTWFQHHPDHAPEDAEEVEDAQVWDMEPEPDAPGTEPAGDDDDDTEPDAAAKPPDPAPRKQLDPAVTEVLRAEADRERAVRRKEADGLETQTELGLETHDDEVGKRGREAQMRMARLKGEPEQVEATPDPGKRRNLLPDIDEINSSLSSDASESTQMIDAGGADPSARSATGGFRRGFLTVVLLAVLGLLLYIYAPRLADAVPALRAPLDSYVETVDQGRLWLNRTLLGVLGPQDGMSTDGG